MKDKNHSIILSGIILAIMLVLIVFFISIVFLIPRFATRLFGAPDPSLDNASRILYSAKLYLNKELLLNPYLQSDSELFFIITPGETAKEIVDGLASAKLINDPEIFTDYLVYKGIDRLLQSGTYVFNPSMNAIELTAALYDTTPLDISFSFLAGWRAEEIAALLPSSGLNVPIEDFMKLVNNPPEPLSAIIASDLTSFEGYLFPGNYQVMKSATAEELTRQLLKNFKNQLPKDFDLLLKNTGLSLKQTIILASIVEKETILKEEAPLIASVFINRLNISMPLQSDPTIQYALGYSEDQNTWWKNPLTGEDLAIDSPYNTYLNPGLPPTPICNPGLTSIVAVLEPAESDYLFFRAACDGSGKHNFSSNYEEHLKAACE